MILLDTSGSLAALDQSQRLHEAAAAALLRAQPPLLLSPFVLAEMDYLLASRVGIDSELAFLDEVGRGVYQLEPMSAEDVAQARTIVDRYRDLDVGLADASIMVLAARHAFRDVLTLDERHFRTMRAQDGSAMRILPADAA
ncbi:MAG: PIN domain-containing protein [Chloroflexi bacterium]|nr:PIN domain-containing protein [Chloroflexota bacterium]